MNLTELAPVHVITREDFPHLFDVPHPPKQLWAQGRAESLGLLYQLPARGLAWVGTRSPRLESRKRVHSSIELLARRGLILISGFARGIDTEVHEAALRSGIPTLAVLAAPIEKNYPYQNFDLRKRILAAGGLMVTEFPEGTTTYASQFLLRNRLIAHWSSAVVVSEAQQRSGALNTASWALSAHIPCFAVPCAPGDPAFGGNQKLLDDEGAIPFWGVHSLGAAWLELSTVQASGKRELPPDSETVLNWIQKKDAHSISDVLLKGQIQSWNSDRIWSALRDLIRQQYVAEEFGRLVLIR